MTKKINIKESFGVSNLGVSSKVLPLLKKINIGKNTHIELDLRHCIIDYPATSLIIDKILSQLFKRKGSKIFHVLHDYILPKETYLKLLLEGSKVLNLQTENAISFKEMENVLVSKLAPKNIEFKIIIYNRYKGKVEKEYKY